MGNTQKKTYQVEYKVKNEQTINIGNGDSTYTLNPTKKTVTRFRISVPEVNSLTIKTSGVGDVQFPSSGGLNGSMGNLVGNLSSSGRLEPRHDVYIERNIGKGKPIIRSLNLIGVNIYCHTEGGGCRIERTNKICVFQH